MRKATILCIEDEKDFRDNLKELLSQHAYEVLEAGDGEDGLALIQEKHPDLVLCDVRMPRKNGLQLLEQLKEVAPKVLENTPFMFLSAYDQRDHEMAGLSLGCDDFISKNADFDLLLARIEKQLHKVKHQPDNQSPMRDLLLGTLPHLVDEHFKAPLERSYFLQSQVSHARQSSLSTSQIDLLATMAKEQLSTARMLSVIAHIASGDYEPCPQPIQLESVIWEACVTALGLDMANELCQPMLAKKAYSHIEADMLLLQLLMHHFMTHLHSYQGHVPHIALETAKEGELQLRIGALTIWHESGRREFHTETYSSHLDATALITSYSARFLPEILLAHGMYELYDLPITFRLPKSSQDGAGLQIIFTSSP